jgi:hypothetical protein
MRGHVAVVGMCLIAALLFPIARVNAASLVFVPSADALVSSTNPTRNYGGSVDLDIRQGTATAGSITYHSYLRFAVAGITGTVTGAKLRLLVTNAGPDGGSVFATDPGWTEQGITWDSAPPPQGGAIASAGAATIGAWVEFDLGASTITADGTYAFELTTGSTDTVVYSSGETANPPQLVV